MFQCFSNRKRYEPPKNFNKPLELWIFPGTNDVNLYNNNENYVLYGHMGFCFDNLSINDPNKKILGFGTSVKGDFDKVFHSESIGAVSDHTEIFRNYLKLSNKHKIFLKKVEISDKVYEKFKDMKPNEYPKNIYGVKCWTRGAHNCISYPIKYFKPISYTGCKGFKGIENTGYTLVPDFCGILSSMLDFFTKDTDLKIYYNNESNIEEFNYILN